MRVTVRGDWIFVTLEHARGVSRSGWCSIQGHRKNSSAPEVLANKPYPRGKFSDDARVTEMMLGKQICDERLDAQHRAGNEGFSPATTDTHPVQVRASASNRMGRLATGQQLINRVSR